MTAIKRGLRLRGFCPGVDFPPCGLCMSLWKVLSFIRRVYPNPCIWAGTTRLRTNAMRWN